MALAARLRVAAAYFEAKLAGLRASEAQRGIQLAERVQGELPVAQRNQGPRAVVARELETQEQCLALQRWHIFREIRAAWDADVRRQAEFVLLSESALPAADRSFELAEEGWHAGRFDWFRALAARALVELRGARIEALAALWNARIALARARGGDVP